MKFVDRVKEILLERKKEELAIIEEKIEEVNKIYSEKQEEANNLKQESDEFSKEKAEFQKKLLSKKELSDLENIYNFVANYPRIQKILDEIKKVDINKNDNILYGDFTREILSDDELHKKYKILETVKELNKKIIHINGADINELIETESNQNEILVSLEENKEVKKQKTGIFSKLFGRKEKDSLKKETRKSQQETIFDKYRKTIKDYKDYYTKFIDLDFEGGYINKAKASRFISDINKVLLAKNNGAKISPEDEEYLEHMKPYELWKELLNYFSNTELITEIVQNFEENIEEYQQKYHENPHILDVENLEKTLQENNQMIIDLKSKKKSAINKNNEFKRKRQNEQEVKGQLKNLESKKKELIEQTKKIESVQTLKQLGFKNKEEAVEKLSIETKDYIVIPIPNEIKNIYDLFSKETQVKIEIDEKTFYGMYLNEIATGKINSIDNLEFANSVLMVPINLLKKENIDNIRNEKISLNKTVLELEQLLIFLPQDRNLETGSSKIKLDRYSNGTVNKRVKDFLGEDYVSDINQKEIYDIFKNIPNVSSEEKKAKREAIKSCLFENLKRDVLHTDKIVVDGKAYFLNQEDERDLQSRPISEPLNEKKLYQISDKIETYLIEEGNKGSKVDQFYEELLLEYMKINKKSKAEYQEESDTEINLEGKRLSIKPPLPAKDEIIAKKYTRPSEDVIYKTMKLANLVNRFAHLAENEELQNTLFDVKLDLIENVIDLSKNNPEIKVKRQFDEDKMVMSVVLEIPNYNMIALHIMNKSESLVRKSNQLEKESNEVLQTSSILIPGVNKELLQALKNMNVEERIQTLLKLDSNTFRKLVLRMGYNSENIESERDRKAFIKNIISDRKINELLNEDELEK